MTVHVVFDLDGTLVDSVGSLCTAGNTLLAELGKPAVDVPTYTGFVGRGVPRQVIELLAHSGVAAIDPEPYIARFREIYEADPLSGTVLYPGANEAVQALNAAGMLLGVCTQKPEAPARAILSALGIMPPIRVVTGGDTLPGILKPDARMLEHAANGLGGLSEKSALVYVGDSVIDSQTAANARVPFVLVAWGYKSCANSDIPHDVMIEDFSELSEAIRAAAKM